MPGRRQRPTRLSSLIGDRTLAALTVANAIHLLPHERLIGTALRLLRPGGGLAVIANGTPLWQQPSDWSQALRRAVAWLGLMSRPEAACWGVAASGAGRDRLGIDL